MGHFSRLELHSKLGFVEDSNVVEESERNIDLGVESDVKSSESESDEAGSSVSESSSD